MSYKVTVRPGLHMTVPVCLRYSGFCLLSGASLIALPSPSKVPWFGQ